MSQPPLPATHSFMVYAPELDEQRQMAAALGYTVTETLVLPSYYVTWNKIDRVTGVTPTVGDLWVDVSRHNWPIDFAALKAAGVKVIYARATLGANGVDDRWLDHRNGALAAGLGLGAYHYFIWNEDGVRQADNFKRVTQDFCTEGPVADAERRRNVPTADPRVFLPEVVDKGVASANFLSLMNNLGAPDTETAGIYSNKIEWETMFNLSAAAVERWWKWIAHYRNGAARWPEPLHLAQPAVPAGWWARVHQYRVAEPGELAWHPRALDLNVYRGELDPGLVGPTPTDPPVVVPPTMHTLGHLTNQAVINLFFKAFGAPYIDKIIAALDETTVFQLRGVPFTGPAIEQMPLTAAEKAALVAAL